MAGAHFSFAAAAEPPVVTPPEGNSAAIPRASQYDLTSRINGRTYRVFVSTPFGAQPGRRYPVLYVLDGNWYFAPASVNATESAGAGELDPAIVVGMGYPTEDNDLVGRRRAFELTPWSPAGSAAGQYGGGDAMLRVLEEEIRPFVNAHYATDPVRQILYGKSFGGLLVLRSLLANPGAYSTYIAASPAIGFDSRAILRDVPGFAARVKAGPFRLRLLITAAGNEQHRDALELAGRLAALDPGKLQVEQAVIPDESHVSVSLASVGRALSIAVGHPAKGAPVR
jgi:predicted alpha/beta superfamily hydrolase